jgi:SAM-dependent methyltransferase
MTPVAAKDKDIRACGGCGSTRFVPDPDCTVELPGSEGAFLYRCSVCGLSMYQPQLSVERLAALYDSNYYKSGYLALEGLYRPLIHRVIDRRLNTFFKTGSRILDVGAGAGFWLDAWAGKGHSVEAFEPSPEALQFLRAKGYRATDTWERIEGRFDGALLMDVLGHIPNASEIVGRIAERLKPEAHLIIRAPYFRGAWRKLQKRRAFRQGAGFPGYPSILWRFEPRDLSHLLARKGFEVIETFYEVMPWSGRRERPLRLAFAAWDRIRGQGDEFYVIAKLTRSGLFPLRAKPAR